jgi:predicted membrane protein
VSTTAVSIVCGILFAFIVGWDIYLNSDRIKDNTISARTRALGRAWPPARILILFGIGVLMGHFFWTPQDVYDSKGSICQPK